MAKSFANFLLFLLLTAAWANCSPSSGGPSAFPPRGFGTKLSVWTATGEAKAPAPLVLPRPQLQLSVMTFDNIRRDVGAMQSAAIVETIYKFKLMKAKLDSKTQNELRKMDPANQSIEKQYEFLVQRRLGLAKAKP